MASSFEALIQLYWSAGLPQKLTVPHPIYKFPQFSVTRSFPSVFTITPPPKLALILNPINPVNTPPPSFWNSNFNPYPAKVENRASS